MEKLRELLQVPDDHASYENRAEKPLLMLYPKNIQSGGVLEAAVGCSFALILQVLAEPGWGLGCSHCPMSPSGFGGWRRE